MRNSTQNNLLSLRLKDSLNILSWIHFLTFFMQLQFYIRIITDYPSSNHSQISAKNFHKFHMHEHSFGQIDLFFLFYSIQMREAWKIDASNRMICKKKKKHMNEPLNDDSFWGIRVAQSVKVYTRNKNATELRVVSSSQSLACVTRRPPKDPMSLRNRRMRARAHTHACTRTHIKHKGSHARGHIFWGRFKPKTLMN